MTDIVEFPDRRRVEQEAADWLIRLDRSAKPSTDELEDLRDWLGRSPAHREELLSLQVLLSADPDDELAEVAAKSIKEEEEQILISWLRSSPPGPLVLDLLIRVRNDESIWAVTAQCPTGDDHGHCEHSAGCRCLLQELPPANRTS